MMIVKNRRIENSDADVVSRRSRCCPKRRASRSHAGRRFDMTEQAHFLIERKMFRAAKCRDFFGRRNRQFDHQHIQIFRPRFDHHVVVLAESRAIAGFLMSSDCRITFTFLVRIAARYQFAQIGREFVADKIVLVRAVEQLELFENDCSTARPSRCAGYSFHSSHCSKFESCRFRPLRAEFSPRPRRTPDCFWQKPKCLRQIKYNFLGRLFRSFQNAAQNQFGLHLIFRVGKNRCRIHSQNFFCRADSPERFPPADARRD